MQRDIIYRDIRDVFLSMKNKFQYKDDDFFNSKFSEKYIEEYNEWSSIKMGKRVK